MAKKGKGFFGALGSALGSIPVVGKVKKAAKKKLKKAKKKLKKALKKAKKKLKKKLGKVLTKARKLKNNLSKSKLVKRFKKAVKKAVKKAKKYVKKVVKTVKKAVKTVVKAVKKAAKTTVKAVKTAAKTTANAAKSAAKATANAAKSAAKTTANVAKSAAKTTVNVAKSATKKAAVAVKSVSISQAISTAADFIPGVGNAKAVFETAFGFDPFTLDKLSAVDRGISAAGILGGGIAKAAGKGGKATLNLFSNSKNATNAAETAGKNKINVDDFNPSTATNKQKGNYGEIISSDNLLNNQSLKDAGYDLKPIGRGAPSSVNDKIVKGIDGLYQNKNADSNIKYVIDEAKFGSSQLSKTPKDGPQMSDDWLKGTKTKKSRILKAVDGDEELAEQIEKSLRKGEVDRVLSNVDSSGNVKTYKLNAKGEIIGEWP